VIILKIKTVFEIGLREVINVVIVRKVAGIAKFVSVAVVEKAVLMNGLFHLNT